MNHTKAVLLALLLLPLFLSAQVQELDCRYQGSAKALDGNIYVLTVFTGERPWPKKAVDAIITNVYEAQGWLEQQARRYGKTVSFTNGSFGHPDPIRYYVATGTGSGNESTEVVWEVMKKIGYQNPADFVQWAKDNADCDNALVLVLTNTPGTSYALAYRDDFEREKYYLEGAVIYTTYQSGGETCSGSIAHEMCHLFGAEDLYETFSQTKENEAKAQKLYPNDIMLRVSYDINELVVDEMTAWYIGLTNKEKSWYRDFLKHKQ